MARPRIRVGNIVHCIFLDHAQNSDDALKFEVFGRVTKITRTSYIIHYWRYVDDPKKEPDFNHKDNEDNYAIVKSTIDSIRILARK